MTPVLDVRTLVLIYVGIRIGQAAVMVYLWRVQRNYSPARDWALGSLLSAGGLFLLALRMQAPIWITDVLANVLLLPGWMLFDYGIIRAARLNPPVRHGWALLCDSAGIHDVVLSCDAQLSGAGAYPESCCS